MRLSAALLSVFFLAVSVTASAAPEAGSAASHERDLRRLFRKGAHAVRTKRYDKAMRAYEEALRIDPLDVDVYYNLVSVAKALRRCGDVLLYGRAHLYLDPRSSDAKEVRGMMHRCQTLMEESGARLSVKVDPEGAEVFVDGAIQGRAPLLELLLKSGRHQLRATHPDCEPYEERFELEERGTAQVAPKLKRRVYHGGLLVRTKPEAGVKVYVDEKPVGETPLKEPISLETRRYLMRLESPGWDRWVRYVTIRRDETTTVEATLERTEGEKSPKKPDKPTEPPPILRR